MKQLINELLVLEAKIINYYFELANIEIKGLDKGEYNEFFCLLLDVLKEEEILVDILAEFSYKDIVNYLNLDNVCNLPINLGFNRDAVKIRLKNILDVTFSDEVMQYACSLKYDMDKLALKMLDYLINNDAFMDIREELIYYKYDIIATNYDIQEDFLAHLKTDEGKLYNHLFIKEFPSLKFVENAVLITPCQESINFLSKSYNEKTFNRLDYFLITRNIINILVIMGVSREGILDKALQDFNNLLIDENLDEKIKEYILDLIEIFRKLENSFYFAR